MKAYRRITIITILLFIITLVFAAFIGIYVFKIFRAKNIMPEYELGMELTGRRIVEFNVADSGEDEFTNNEEDLTEENFKRSKEIIEKKLKVLGASQYVIRQDINTGKIIVEIPDNDFADEIIENLGNTGRFSIIDYETKDVLLSQDQLQTVDVLYSRNEENETSVYLKIQFNDEGTEKLKEIVTTYIASESEENDDENTEDTGKYVSMLYNNETYIDKTSFSNDYPTDALYLTFGSSSEAETLNSYVKNASTMAANLNAGKMPIIYESTVNVEGQIVSNNTIMIAIYSFAGLNLIGFIVFIVKYKKSSLYGIMLQLGYIALLIITLRVLKITVTIEGAMGIVISAILNYIFLWTTFNEIYNNKGTMKKAFAKFALRTIPICVIAIIFTFGKTASVYSLGTTLVWGSFVLYLYNLVLTNILLKVSAKEE